MLRPPGVINNTNKADVIAANGTWRENVTCSSGQPPNTRVLTSATQQQMFAIG
jgi:hypothetical protein